MHTDRPLVGSDQGTTPGTSELKKTTSVKSTEPNFGSAFANLEVVDEKKSEEDRKATEADGRKFQKDNEDLVVIIE